MPNTPKYTRGQALPGILDQRIAIGYRDESDPVNAFDRKREPLESKVQFLGFE